MFELSKKMAATNITRKVNTVLLKFYLLEKMRSRDKSQQSTGPHSQIINT